MVKQKKYYGVVVPMITPFTANGETDLHASERIAQHIRATGACVFALGTTGEAVSINFTAKTKLVETVVKNNSSQTLTYAGIIDNCLATSVDMASRFFELGVDVVVACVPSYYPLTNDDILNYFEALAEQVAGPLMLYNIPATTGVSIPLEVIDRLSHHPAIMGLKDSDSDIERMKQAVEMSKDREDFTYLNGCTSLSTTALTMGADGIVPGIGNIVPHLYTKLYNAVLSGDLEMADRCQSRSNDIADILQKNKSLSESLSVLKAIMHILGFCSPKMLPPLRELTAEQIQALRETVNNMRLLEENHPL
jgi:dihydrodipicolinate synthase/N-acetylneuraminate lyase